MDGLVVFADLDDDPHYTLTGHQDDGNPTLLCGDPHSVPTVGCANII